MTDIRLKTITVESLGNLTVQRGDVNITNTTTSTNRLNGALIVNGGIAINNTYDSVSSTSGGALTVGGGLAVRYDTYFGNNVILDNNIGTLSVQGITSDRLFLDSVTNKRVYISPDGVNKRFDLRDTRLNVDITSESTNASTGAVVVSGGISITSTVNSTNSSNGGSLTVGGGVAIGGDTYLSKSLTLGTPYSDHLGILVRYTGASQIALQSSDNSTTSTLNMDNKTLVVSNENDLLFSTTKGNFVFANASTGNTLLTIQGMYSTFGKFVKITDTTESTNLTTGCLIVNGGITIQCTRDASSPTSGGALTIVGGLSLGKKMFTNDSIGIELLNGNKTNKLVLYQVSGSLQEANLYTGLGVTNGSLRFQVPDTSNDHLFYSSNSSGNSSEVFRIKGTNEVQFIGNQQRYSILAGGNTVNDLSIQGQSVAAPSSLCLFTKDGDSNDANDIKIFGRGLPNNITNSEYVNIGWTTNEYTIATRKTGTGIDTPIVIQSNSNDNQLKLLTDGTVYTSSTAQSTNSSTGGLVVQGGMSVSGTVDSVSSDNGGSLTVAGGASIMKSMYIGGVLNVGDAKIYSQDDECNLSSPVDRFVFSGDVLSSKYTGSLSLFSLNNVESGDYEVISISSNSTDANLCYNIHSKAGGLGDLHPVQMSVGDKTHIFLSTGGSIGMNTTSPMYKLDLNGTMQVNDYTYINQVTVYSTDEATDSSTSGSLTVCGGASVAKNLFVGGQTTFTDTTDASSTSASVYMAGGLTVASGEVSNYGFGALTVLGGGYIGGELYVQENLNVFGSINGGGASASTFAYMTITATDESLNLSSGSLLTFGGITVLSYANAQNVSNGGSFLTPGGASVGKDLYVGGDTYNYGSLNLLDTSSNLIKFYDSSNLTRFSIDRNLTSNNFSISRYDSNGTFVEKSIDISNATGQIQLHNSTQSTGYNSASLITDGGITVNCTSYASTKDVGGGLTVLGGSSVSKNFIVGGDVTFLSTTDSTNANEGALRVSGGVGIHGNVNINGNTVITGNLSILGTTNSIYSTNTYLSDNILVINSGPSGTSDGGILIERYQRNNDTGSGDVVNDTSQYTQAFTLPNQSGMSTIQLKLSVLANDSDGFYVGWWIKVTSGFSSNQVRKVTGYDGITRILTLDAVWTDQNPSIGDSVQIYDKPYVGILWNETNDTFEFGATAADPGHGGMNLTQFAAFTASSAKLTSTSQSSCSSVGTLVVSGGVSIRGTSDAISSTCGNGLTIEGGASIGKSLFVGTNLYVAGVNITPNTHDSVSSVTFSAANNTVSANLIDFTDNSVWGFDVYLSARLVATIDMFSNYHLRAVNKGTSWEVISNYVGDSILSFNITNAGQLQYSTIAFDGFESLTFKYKVLTN